MSTELEIKYELLVELKESQGAVNAIAFSQDGEHLLSGGDDGCVRIWNTQTFECKQILQDQSWGQVTTLAWVWTEPPAYNKTISISVGSGMGVLYICPMAHDTNWFLSKKASTLSAFDFNDVVEVQAYDPLNQCLAVASYLGQIKMFLVENGVWLGNINNAIPRGILFFGGANQSLLVHGLDTGEMCCRDAQSSNIIWSKTLAGGIGHAVLSPDQSTLIVDNLTTGTFDSYNFPASMPTFSFALTSTQRFIKQCIFAEDGKVVVCGSDSGKVYVVDGTTGERIQTLKPDKVHGMMQVVAAITVKANVHLVAGGSTGLTPSIYLWQKKEVQNKTPQNKIATVDVVKTALETEASIAPTRTGFFAQLMTTQTIIHIVLTLIIIVITYPSWSPHMWRRIGRTSKSITLFLGEFSETISSERASPSYYFSMDDDKL